MNFLQALETLARYWNLISTDKYKYRCKPYGTHNDAITKLLPRHYDASFFAIQTLLISNKKPIGVTENGDKISMATREYFYHCAKL